MKSALQFFFLSIMQQMQLKFWKRKWKQILLQFHLYGDKAMRDLPLVKHFWEAMVALQPGAAAAAGAWWWIKMAVYGAEAATMGVSDWVERSLNVLV